VKTAAATGNASFEERQIVHEELNRLPARYRTPLILCYLQGKSREEAAREVGCSPGSMRGRLERGREKLRERLTRRGLALSAGTLSLWLDNAHANVAVPATLLATTMRVAWLSATGAGTVSVS